jgi:hypothetical protein
MDDGAGDSEDSEDLGKELHLGCLSAWLKTAGEKLSERRKVNVLIAPGRVAFKGFR